MFALLQKEKRPDPGDFAEGSDRLFEAFARRCDRRASDGPRRDCTTVYHRGVAGAREVGPADADVARRFKRPTGPASFLMQVA